MNEPDSLKVLKEVLERATYLELANPDPWKVIIMSISMLFSFSVEPVIVFFLLRYAAFRDWCRDLFEDSDKKPNAVDLRNFLAYYIGILHIGRVIVVAALFQIFFGANLTELILILSAIMLSVITGNALIGLISFKKK